MGCRWKRPRPKKRKGELPADYPTAVLKPFIDGLALEVTRALQFFFTSTPFHSVQHILVFGGSASLEGLEQAIAMQTSVPVTVANPFLDMRLGSDVRKARLSQEAPAYLTACGLAMRRFLQ